jgi:hypothetical protein
MNRFDTIAPKVASCVRMLSSSFEGDVISAVRALLKLLNSAGLDIHDLSDRIEKGGGQPPPSSLDTAQLQCIYDAAYQKGFADGSEHGRKSAILAGPSIGTFSTGVNGYSWREIANYCAANKHLFHGRDCEFVESIAEQLQFRAITPPQAKWLKDLFMRRFDGRIT